MMRKILLVLLAVMALSAAPLPSSSAAPDYYLGNPRSMKFHYADCRTIKHPENFVVISTRDAAIASGYKPCGVCKP